MWAVFVELAVFVFIAMSRLSVKNFSQRAFWMVLERFSRAILMVPIITREGIEILTGDACDACH
jgi:hypothetical protein